MRGVELYGRSLYDLCNEEHVSGQVLQDIETVEEIFRENPEYLQLLSEPSIKKAERLKLLDEAFREEIHPYLKNFLSLLLERHGLLDVKTAFHRYEKLYRRDHNIAVARVVTAIPLTEERRAQLRELLEKRSGKTVLLREKVDPDILGGVKVTMDNVLLDGTVQTRLQTISDKVLHASI